MLTHAHEDHIGAVPWAGCGPRIKAVRSIATPFTAYVLIRDKLERARI